MWLKREDREGCVSHIHSELARAFEGGLPAGDPGIILVGILLLAALLLGIPTAVSPCPLATNLAAVAYIASYLGKRGRAVAAGALYALGRALAYVVLGVLLVYLGANVARVTDLLHDSSVYYLGPPAHLRLPGDTRRHPLLFLQGRAYCAAGGEIVRP